MRRLSTAGRVVELERRAVGLQASCDMAHTRWAIHSPHCECERNAYPYVSGGVTVAHSGIIENHEAQRVEPQGRGYAFSSDADAEIIAHLVEDVLRDEPDLFAAARRATARLADVYVIALIDERCIVVAREGSPLLLCIGERGVYAVSDVSALLQTTRRFIYLEKRATPCS